MKTCSRCKKEKEASDFRERESSKDGLHCWCEQCLSAYYAENYEKNKEKKKAERIARYQIEKEQIKEKSRRYHAENKESIGARQKRYRAEKMAQLREKNKAWREANRDHLNAKRGEWQRSNKGAVCEIRARRRAAEYRATPRWYDRLQAKKIYDEAAKLRAAGADVHVDHIVPLRGKNVCGLHVHWNMQILDAKENLSKGNRVLP